MLLDFREKVSVHLIARTQVDWSGVKAWFEHMGWSIRESSLMELAARRCYRSFREKGGQLANRNLTRIREDSYEYMANVLKQGHESVLEHVSFTFAIEGVSRVFTHELVRHRVGVAYSQESLRFVKLEDFKLSCPEELEGDEIFEELLKEVEYLQGVIKRLNTQFLELANGFTEKKRLTSIIRRIAPIGLATGIVVTMNARALRHILELRTSPAAEVEIREVMQKIGEIVREVEPLVLLDFEVVDGWWRKVK